MFFSVALVIVCFLGAVIDLGCSRCNSRFLGAIPYAVPLLLLAVLWLGGAVVARQPQKRASGVYPYLAVVALMNITVWYALDGSAAIFPELLSAVILAGVAWSTA